MDCVIIIVIYFSLCSRHPSSVEIANGLPCARMARACIAISMQEFL